MKTVNIRIYESTHKVLKDLASKRRQDMVVVLDAIVNGTFISPKAEKSYKA